MELERSGAAGFEGWEGGGGRGKGGLVRIAVAVTSECECEIWDGFLQFGPIPQLAPFAK